MNFILPKVRESFYFLGASLLPDCLTLRCVVGLTSCPAGGPGSGQAGLRNMVSENRASFKPD